MNLEEEHEELHRRGELGKFLVLVVLLLITVLLVAALRPLIFEGIVPAMMGWEEPSPSLPAAPATETPAAEQEQPVIMTATPAAEGLPTATPATTVAPPASATPLVYEVQTGDTLAEIAARFGVTIEALVEANGLGDPNRIQSGDALVIPAP